MEKDNNMDGSQSTKLGPIFYSALVMGLVMIGIGAAFEVMHLSNFSLKVFMFCAGIGIILGAFGSTARLSIPGQSLTVVGSAALAIGIFFVVLNNMDGRYLRVMIEGNDTRQAVMTFEGDNDFFGSRLKNSYDFVVFDKNINRKKLKLIVNIGGMEQIFSCIDSSLLLPHLGSGDTLQWTYSAAEASLRDGANNVIANVGPCRGPARTGGNLAQASVDSGDLNWSFWPTANATESAPVTTSAEAVGIDRLIENLSSDSTNVRRDARTELGKLGTPAVKPLLNEVRKVDSSYRTTLGALVSLNEITESQAGQEADLKTLVDDEDMTALVKASTNKDETIQSFATNVVVNLKDPRAIPAAIQQFPQSSAEGQRNLLWVLTQAMPLADQAQRRSAIDGVLAMEPSDEMTSELLKTVQSAAE
ncbi:hypothetical protein M5G25_21830 [Pseudomonas sp. TNT2022 ID357]|uniref:HEAT repeat domain-containing protein n=1 Tax=Pseudomonas idahonensis TaxID=2942628 RepID=A0ABT5Q9V3_9PSED|nr:hypothetical protein [Pseudomonas idahonensis]MDD1150928.1 hypothetical protein [Pseudomonas idahonensis]